jgi:DNA-binding CsgD family transcriptional regulator
MTDPDLSIDEAYALIDRHIAAVARLRVRISDAVAAREAAVARELGEVTSGTVPLLTNTEQQTLRYYANTHMTTAQIAAALFVSPNTTKTHLKNIFKKLGVRRRRDLVEKVKGLGEAI